MGVMSRTKTNRQPSMGDVAAAVRVSKTTISRYLHGNFGYRGVSGCRGGWRIGVMTPITH